MCAPCSEAPVWQSATPESRKVLLGPPGEEDTICMYLSHLALTDFRNFKQLELPLGPGLFLFHGENAQGKTNLLEAVTMLTTAHSFHTTSDREVMSWDSTEHLTRLRSTAAREGGPVQIE